MLRFNNLVGFGAGGAGGAAPATITYKGEKKDTATRSTFTFTSCDIGAAAADRHVFVGCGGWNNTGGSNSYTSCTINAVSATKITDGTTTAEHTASSSVAIAALFGAPVTAGTSVSIVVNSSISMTNTGIIWWITSGLQSLTAGEVELSTAKPSGTLTPAGSAGGIAIGYGVSAWNGGTYTWTGVTEDVDVAIEAGGGTHTGASDELASAGDLSVTLSNTGSSALRTIIATLR